MSENFEMPGASRCGSGQSQIDARQADAAPVIIPEITAREDGEDEGGQWCRGTHPGVAALVTHSEIVGREAGEGEADQTSRATHAEAVGLATIDAIREEWRHRQAWHRAEKSLVLQAKALCRRLAVEGDKAEAERIYKAALGKGQHPMAAAAAVSILPLDEARKVIAASRKAAEKRLTKIAADLPVAPWVNATRGVGLLSLAAIVGEAGDLSNYANPGKLWKRMGMAVMKDGTRQRRVGGIEAVDHGFNPARRSTVWNIGACIVKAGGPLKAIYDRRKIYEIDRVETKLHAHNRAKRYAEKEFLRMLWSAWRKGGGGHRTCDPHDMPVAPVT